MPVAGDRVAAWGELTGGLELVRAGAGMGRRRGSAGGEKAGDLLAERARPRARGLVSSARFSA